jgi:hypothetical protein
MALISEMRRAGGDVEAHGLLLVGAAHDGGAEAGEEGVAIADRNTAFERGGKVIEADEGLGPAGEALDGVGR